MRQDPPAQLVTVLGELGLCGLRDLRAAQPRVNRLARDLPAFDQVWIDALVQARRITPFQAELLSRDEGSRLKVGPYVLMARLGRSDLSETYHARPIARGRPVALKVLDAKLVSEDSAASFAELLTKLQRTKSRHLALPRASGVSDGRVWLASPLIAGPNGTELLIHYGRLAPALVAEVAQHLLHALEAVWSNALVHGDVHLSRVRVSARGRAILTDVGVRVSAPDAAIVSARGLPPERFDYLAPEAFATGKANTPAADQYALGCVLWHLLTGRPPFPGAEADAKRVARQRRELPDVRELAPATPAALAELIAVMTRRDPDQRPDRPAAMLRTWRGSRAAARRRLARMGRPLRRRMTRQSGARRRWQPAAAAILATGGLAVAAIAFNYLSDQSFTDALARFRPGASTRALWSTEATTRATTTLSVDGSRIAPSDSTVQPVQAVSAVQGVRVVTLSDRVYRVQGDQLKASLRSSTPLKLEAGLRVKGPQARPTIILIDEQSLEVSVPDMHWENVRFVLNATAAGTEMTREASLVTINAPGCRFLRCTFEVQDTSDATKSLVAVSARDVQFDECTFQGIVGPAQRATTELPAAVHWSDPQNRPPHIGLSRDVSFRNCVFRGLSTALAIDVSQPLKAALTGCRHGGPGSVIRLALSAAATGQIAIDMSECTVQGAEAVVQFDHRADPAKWAGFVFAPRNCRLMFDRNLGASDDFGALVALRGAPPTPTLLRKIRWLGFECFVQSPAPIPAAVWSDGTGNRSLSPSLLEFMNIEGTRAPVHRTNPSR